MAKKAVVDSSLFDSWSDEQEEAAVQAAAAAASVDCILVEGRLFAGRFPDGTILSAPLDITLSDLDEVIAAADSPVDQLKALFKLVGDEAGAEVLTQQGVVSGMAYANKFFQMFERVAQVALGKF